MKYSELEKILREAGCYDTEKQANGHPVWYSPITDKKFRLSNHKSKESGYRNSQQYFESRWNKKIKQIL